MHIYKILKPLSEKYILGILVFLLFQFVGCKNESVESANESVESANELGYSVIALPVLAEDIHDPIIAIFIEHRYAHLMPDPNMIDIMYEPQVVVTIWADGKIIWSEDQISGGRPYFMSQLDTNKIDIAISQLNELGIFSDTTRFLDNYPFDFSHVVIAICHDEQQLCMSSVHEYFDKQPDLITTYRGGVEVLNGRSRDEVMAQQPPEYKRFIKNWAAIRKVIDELIPEEGQQVNEIHFERIWKN